MSVTLVLGAQWGDEGKGKIVDVLSTEAEIVARFGGGANAGHTLVVNGEKTVIRLVPSGVLRPHTQCVLGNGTVIDLDVLQKEIEQLEPRVGSLQKRIKLSDRAHLVLPFHRAIDAAREEGKAAIGTTKRGIGPAYEDKAARRGIRVADLFVKADWKDRIEHQLTQSQGSANAGDINEAIAYLERHEAWVKPLVADTSDLLHSAWKRGKNILVEGAQGTLLDIDHGTYPYVTSSSTTAGGACTGTGLPPRAFDRIIGIAKAYVTRVGKGPFPTELENETGDWIRTKGHEFGSVTGRPRRCGWLDLPLLKKAHQLNGFDELCLTKLDVLAGLPEVLAATEYSDGKVLESQWKTFRGWSDDVANCSSSKDLPASVHTFVETIEQAVGCKVRYVGVGPGREALIER